MDTNNLINQVIDHVREPTVSEPLSPNRSVMIRLWERMLETYGHKWEGSYGTMPNQGWISTLKGISPEMIRFGLEKMATVAAYQNWPPSALAFRELCLPTSEDLGLPSEDEAFAQAVGNSSEKHPSVVMTLSEMDVYKLRRAETEKARTLFKKHWDQTVQHVAAGGELPEVKLEIEDKPVKASRETAAEGMAALKGLFGD